MVRLALLVEKASKRRMHAKTLYQSSKKLMFALLFYRGISQSVTFQVTHALPIRVKCFDAALQCWICL